MYRHCAILTVCTLLIACGGDATSNTNPNTKDSANPDYSELEPAELAAKRLKLATQTELETHLKNGIRLDLTNSPVQIPANDVLAPPALASTAENSQFSETNVQVKGVDEADFVKYDGRYIYAASHPSYVWGQTPPEAAINIFETTPATAGLSKVGQIPIDNGHWGEVAELYLVKTQQDNTRTLATLRSSWNFVTAAQPAFASDALTAFWPGPSNNKVQVTTFDVTDPANPVQSWMLEIDGYLQGSRKIDNMLYLVMQYNPYINDLVFLAQDIENDSEPSTGDTTTHSNENKIGNTALANLLPQASINSGQAFPLVASKRCFIPIDTTENHGYRNIISLVAIDLATQTIRSSLCLNTHVSGIYSSTGNLYLGGSSQNIWNGNSGFSVFHKFSLANEQISYRSTGVVPGILGWDKPSFRMDEYNQQLRVITTTRDLQFQPTHQLSILQDATDSDEMTLVSRLPNDAQPQAIGKPNEDIYAVRFRQDRAFIVTFERIDPLYVLDLSDAAEPKIAGELEVPGFSTYLHPVGDHYLLGIGRDATEDGQQLGVKTSLYDIRELSAPSEIEHFVFGTTGSSSPAIYDQRALSFLQKSDDQLRFTMPISQTKEAYLWQDEGLYLFEINGLSGEDVHFEYKGKIVSETADNEKTYPDFQGMDRSVLHDDAIYYIHGSGVWSALWNNPEVVVDQQ